MGYRDNLESIIHSAKSSQGSAMKNREGSSAGKSGGNQSFIREDLLIFLGRSLVLVFCHSLEKESGENKREKENGSRRGWSLG